jgi:drug/metabolite transporter (DMT)-like permease
MSMPEESPRTAAIPAVAPDGRTIAIAQALTAVVVWGASFASTKRLLSEMAPETILFARCVFGIAPLVVLLAWRGRLRLLPAREWPRIVGFALLGLLATQLLQAFALERSSSANTAWLVALNPVVTAVLAAWLIGEGLTGKVAGLAIAFAGALLVLSGGHSFTEVLGLPSTRGDLLTLVSTVTWALYTIYGRSFVSKHDPALVTAHVLGCAALALAPFFLVRSGWDELARLSPTGWMCLFYLGFACSGVAFMLYYAALEHLEASQVAAFIYIEPVIAQALSVAFLGEPLTASLLAGGAAILLGLWLVSHAESRRVVARESAA